MSISAIRSLDQAYFSTSSKPTLRYGSSGNSVSDLQRTLTSLGYSPGSIDGDFGRNTQKAVQNFQRAYGLET